MILVNVLAGTAIADLQRGWFVSEYDESERRVETLRGSLTIADGENDAFESRQGIGALQHTAEQATRDAAPSIIRIDEYAPDFRLVALLQTDVPSESDGADELAAGEGAKHELIVTSCR